MRRHLNAVAMTTVLLLLGSLIALSGCYVGVRGGAYEGEVEVDGPPPAVQDEAVIASPGPGYVWIGGAWDWNAGRRNWDWKSGRWERPPRSGVTWERGHFETRSGHHYYRSGHWHDH
jgi:WXXGXW repeat (2 copies)